MPKIIPVPQLLKRMPIVGGPAFEYIRLMRSFLSRDTLRAVSDIVDDDWEQYACDVVKYTDLLQSYLSPVQRNAVSERLEAIYLQRGWSV
jgi:hypothetical protein